MSQTAPQASPIVPARIFTDIDAQPPLRRAEFIRQYLGVEVDWPATLFDATEGPAGHVRIACHVAPRSMHIIVGNVILASYPQLQEMRAGEPLRLCGTIRKIDVMCIELEIRDLMFAQAAEAAH